MVRLSVIEADPAGEQDRALPFAEVERLLAHLLDKGDAGRAECPGVIDLIDAAVAQALLHRASDIHLEPWEDCTALRYRIDGLLHVVARLPRKHHEQIVGRIKVLARVITYQKDVPQDGRIDPDATPSHRAMRVSTFPTVYGEKVVIRLLDADPGLFSLDALGFTSAVVSALRAAIERPQGTLLLTGPASSGKTTTIYALLQEILERRAPTAHVVTIEDPVEYRLGRVAQTEVNPHVGFTFEAALRAVLRQDPEVIALGEIRDRETAHAAIQAGLTGHLVISTIHSGTAAGVFTRLLDMGVEPFLVASSVTGVLAQRLVRKCCPKCAAKGCEACQGIGYTGRTAIGELLVMNDAIAELILGRARTHTIHEAAMLQGMAPLQTDAATRIRDRITTLEEVRRVLFMPDEEGA